MSLHTALRPQCPTAHTSAVSPAALLCARVSWAGDQGFEVPHCRTRTPGDSAHKIPISLERGAAVPGQPGGNGAASQCDLLTTACTVILEMWKCGRESSSLSLLPVPVLGEGTQSRRSPKHPFPRKGSPGMALGSSDYSSLWQPTLHFPLSA